MAPKNQKMRQLTLRDVDLFHKTVYNWGLLHPKIIVKEDQTYFLVQMHIQTIFQQKHKLHSNDQILKTQILHWEMAKC